MLFDKKIFRSVENSTGGDVGHETLFYYHQQGDLVLAEYSGGAILKGFLIATVDSNNKLNMRYQHVNTSGELMTGICMSTPEILANGRIRLHEKWQWTCGDCASGESIVEEITHES